MPDWSDRDFQGRGWIGSLCLLAVLVPSAGARPVDPERMMRRLEKQIAREKKVRLETAALQLVIDNPRLSADTLRAPGDAQKFSFDEIREISAYRNYSGRGAGVGALVGVGAGALLGAWADALSHEESGQCPSGDCGADYVALMAVGAGVGALLGAVIAIPFNGWTSIYRRPGDPGPPGPDGRERKGSAGH